MFSEALTHKAQKLLEHCRAKGWMLTTAESCTGGLIAGLITSIAGSSDVLERGFVTYSNESKQAMLGVPVQLLETYGAVSAEVAQAMAQGALIHSRAQLSLAVTGIAGPGGGTPQKPVGLVYIAAAGAAKTAVREHHFTGGREEVRLQAVEAAIELAFSV